jgi:hypothetical protein
MSTCAFANNVPESYSLVLSFLLQAGIPVIVRDIGAQKERVVKHKAGFVFHTQGQLYTILENIDKDRTILVKISKIKCSPILIQRIQ